MKIKAARVGFLLLVVVGSILVFARHRSNGILDAADSIVDIQSSHPPVYHWLNNRFIVLRINRSNDSVGFYRINVRSREIQPAVDLFKCFQGLLMEYSAVSHDGTWCAGSVGTLSQQKSRSISQVAELNRDGGPGLLRVAQNVVWLPDNRRWVGLLQDSHPFPPRWVALEFSLDDEKVKRYVIPDSVRLQTWPDKSVTLLGATHPNRILAVFERTTEYPDIAAGIKLFEFGVGLEDGYVRHLTIPTPVGTKAATLALSPDGKRLASIAYRDVPYNVADRLLQLFRIGSSPKRVAEFAISRIGGAQSTLGSLRLDNARTSHFRVSQRFAPILLKWSPDSKRLSFVYKNKLLCLDVPE